MTVAFNSALNGVTILDMQQDFDPEEYRSAIINNANSEHIRWWQARYDLTFDDTEGISATKRGKTKWNRIENTSIAGYYAQITGAKSARIWFPDGDIQQSDITVTTMGDEIPIEDHDWVMPIGRQKDVENFYPDARIVRRTGENVRGAVDAPQVGKVTSAGNVVSGNGTLFASNFRPGDIIRALSQSYRVDSVASDTSLTIDAAPNPAWNSHSFVKGLDLLLHTPAALIFDARDAGTIYIPDTDVLIGADQITLQWLSATRSPAPGARYSITYGQQPIYEVMSDLGEQHHVVRGKLLVQTVVCRLRNQETIQR